MKTEVFFILAFGTSGQELHKIKYQYFLVMPNFALFLDIALQILTAIATSKKSYWFLLRMSSVKCSQNITAKLLFQ